MNILIQNAKVIDGTGSPWFWSDIEVEDGKIKQMHRKLKVKADRTIDAKGLVVAPGFVDPHCHPEPTLLFNPELENYVAQGNTTLVIGSDGCASAYPDKDTFLDFCSHFYGASQMMHERQLRASDYNWNSLTDYCQLVMSRRPAINVVPLIGLSAILWKAGFQVTKESGARRLTAKEMAKVKDLIRQGFEQGAIGLSSNRDYEPDKYVSTDDYIEPLKLVAEYGYGFFLHTKLIATPEGVREAIELARKTGVRLHILHLNVCPNWDFANGNRLPEVLGIIEGAREEGLDITFDVQSAQAMDYYYRKDRVVRAFRFICSKYADEPPKGMEPFEQFQKNLKDPKYREEIKRTVLKYSGSPARYYESFFKHLDSVILAKTGDERLEGKTLGKIAKELGTNATDLFFDIGFGVSPVLANKPDAWVIWAWLTGHPNEENCVEAANHPLGMPSSDVPILAQPPEVYWMGPVAFGSMPLYFRRALERGVRLEEAIRKMTSFPARDLGLTDRGILRPGMKADIVIFDPVEYRSVSDYDHPTAKAEGVSYVIVNGRLVLDDGKPTEERPGQVLLRGGR